MRELKSLSKKGVALSLALIGFVYFGASVYAYTEFVGVLLLAIAAFIAWRVINIFRWVVMFKREPGFAKARYSLYQARRARGLGERMRRKVGRIWN